jgi:hypothetical protein
VTPTQIACELARKFGLSFDQTEAIRRAIRDAVNEELGRRRNRTLEEEALWLSEEELNRGIG